MRALVVKMVVACPEGTSEEGLREHVAEYVGGAAEVFDAHIVEMPAEDYRSVALDEIPVMGSEQRRQDGLGHREPCALTTATMIRIIADRAWSDRLGHAVYKFARMLTDDKPTIRGKAQAIVDAVYKRMIATACDDADDIVLAAATLCLAVGIPCRIVGARFGQRWTCWLAYRDLPLTGRSGASTADSNEGEWVTVDVLDPGRLLDHPDEQIVVDCEARS